MHFEIGVRGGIEQDLRWVHQIAYVDSDEWEHNLPVLQCLEAKPNQRQERQATRFKVGHQLHSQIRQRRRASQSRRAPALED